MSPVFLFANRVVAKVRAFGGTAAAVAALIAVVRLFTGWEFDPELPGQIEELFDTIAIAVPTIGAGFYQAYKTATPAGDYDTTPRPLPRK